jgi:hypothetical protein
MIKRVKSKVVETPGGGSGGIIGNSDRATSKAGMAGAAGRAGARAKAIKSKGRLDGNVHINKLADEAVVEFFSGENSSRARSFVLRQLSKYFELDIVPVGIIIDFFV